MTIHESNHADEGALAEAGAPVLCRITPDRGGVPTELHIELLDDAGRVYDSRLLRFDDDSFKENIGWFSRWSEALPIEHAPPPPPPAVITRENWSGQTFSLTFDHADEHAQGDAVTEYWRLEGLASVNELEDVFPPTRCQHEWDCCGRWYQFSRIQFENGLIRRDLHQNV